MFFDEFEFPIITYLEFPSFKQHGWDSAFPPPKQKQLRDQNFEMLSWHAVHKSAHSVVPSHYARSLFPLELRAKISVINEGLPQPVESDPSECQTLAGHSRAFCSRQL